MTAPDLRQRLRDRMTRALLKAWSAPDEYRDVARRKAREDAEVCATAVQPVLDAKDAEIARLNTTLDQAKTWITDWSKRAEAAEAEIARLRALHQQIGDL